MNKFKKIITVFLLVLALIAPTFSGTLTAYALTAEVGAEISISALPSSGELGTAIEIPFGSSVDGTVIVKMYNPRGVLFFDSSVDDVNDISYLSVGAGDYYNLLPQTVGDYSVAYSVEFGDETAMASTYSKEFKITVTGSSPVLDFDVNSEFIIPETTNYDYQIVLPYPTITDADGEELSLQETITYFTNTAGSISGLMPDSATAITFADVNVEGDMYKGFTPLAVDGEGIYTVTYSYSDNGLQVNKTFSVEVRADFDPEDIELDYSLDGSVPESAVTGVEITLPSAITRNSNENNALISSYVEIVVEYDGSEIETITDYMFTPQDDGDYVLTYKVYDFFALANDEVLAEYIYNIKNVEDTEQPDVVASEAYASGEVNNENYDFIDANASIPTNVYVGQVVTLPAIHAVDNVTLSDAEHMTYTRIMINPSSQNENIDTAITCNELASYTFTTAGVYTLEYTAIDEAGNERTLRFTINAAEGFEDNEAPRITLPTLPTYVESGETISFTIPTAIDYESTTSTDTVDSRLEINTYYYLGDDDSNKVLILEDEEDSSLLSFVVPTSIPAGYLHIYVEAIDDGLNSSLQQNVATKTQKINVLDTTDIVVPSFVGDELSLPAVDQNQTVNVGDVKFTDNSPEYIMVNAFVINPNGNRVSLQGLQMQFEEDTLSGTDADGIVVSNGSFVATLAGYYRIVYTVTDVAGNTYVKSYAQLVNDTQAPSFQINSIPNNLELGETINLPAPTVMDNGVEIENEAITTVQFIDSPAYNFSMATYKFTPLEEGVYNFKYLAEDSEGNTSESVVYSVTVSDSVDPIIELDQTFIFPVTAPLTRASESDPYNSIEIPGFIAYDSLNGIEEYMVTVNGPNNETILEAEGAEDVNSNNNYEFTPTKAGTYTVVYTAIDLAGNETSETRTIMVGDNSAPTLTIGNSSVNSPSSFTLNDTLTLDLTSITIVDNEDGEIELDDITSTGEQKFVISLTGPTGATINATEENENEYELTEAGDYTLSYMAIDEAGNERIETVNFQVSADEIDTTTITQTWGIILIVLALLALGGVIIYFVRSRQLIED